MRCIHYHVEISECANFSMFSYSEFNGIAGTVRQSILHSVARGEIAGINLQMQALYARIMTN
jgi:hypothetical protein